MFTNIKAIMEIIKLVLDVFRFINGEIDDYKFKQAVDARKKNFNKFMKAGTMDGMLDVLEGENNEN